MQVRLSRQITNTFEKNGAYVGYEEMKLPEVREKAKALGLIPRNMRKADLIHAIQRREGHTLCFGRSNGNCPYTDCCFMDDCLRVKS